MFVRILSRPHFYDSDERRSENPHRKSGTHDAKGRRGAESIREKHHKCNHEKIYTHTVLNIKDEEIEKIVKKNIL